MIYKAKGVNQLPFYVLFLSISIANTSSIWQNENISSKKDKEDILYG